MKMFQFKKRWIVLLRHAEALKNIDDRHGGAGTALTEFGRSQATEAAFWLAKSKFNFKSAWYSHQPQVIETLKIIKEKLNLRGINHKYLTPLDLGKLAGLSRVEASKLFPKEAMLMEEWRRGNLEVQELHFPGGESPIEFYNRGLKFYEEVVSLQNDNMLIITSRSVMILIISILLGRIPIRGGGYVEIPMKPCDIFSFFHDGNKWKFSKPMSSGQIKEE